MSRHNHSSKKKGFRPRNEIPTISGTEAHLHTQEIRITSQGNSMSTGRPTSSRARHEQKAEKEHTRGTSDPRRK